MRNSEDAWDRARETNRALINRVAETQYLIRPKLLKILEATAITEEGRSFFGKDWPNFLDYWRRSYGEAFFDMGTLLRLATSVEDGLRECYLQVAGEDKLVDLLRRYRNVFQQLLVPQGLLVKCFREDLACDLEANPEWTSVRLLMAHRHLYAHRAGQIDQRYVEQILTLTGEDLGTHLDPVGWPAERVYWLRPLQNLNHMVEEVRRFFNALPS